VANSPWDRPGDLAEELALEPGTTTSLLKRLEASGFVSRKRNPGNERQVVVTVTDDGRALKRKAGCLAEALLEHSGATPAELGQINGRIKGLRDAIHESLGGRKAPGGQVLDPDLIREDRRCTASRASARKRTSSMAVEAASGQ
jgi:DNA-binding MarR family transcriptional regulator